MPSTPLPVSIPKLAFTVSEAVATGLFSRSGLYNLLAAGVIKACKSGARTLILAEELDRYRRSLPEAQIGKGSVINAVRRSSTSDLGASLSSRGTSI
jgi:hypothetical protein